MNKTLLILVALVCFGCSGGGGGGSNNGGDGGGTPAPAAVAGKWEIISTSTQNPGGSYPYAAIEANLTQTGTSVFAGDKAAFVILFSAQGPGALAPLNPCGGLPQATINSTLSGQNLSFTLTETGPGGSYVITGTATVSSDAQSISGSYTSPAACGTAADAGTLSGTLVPSVNGTYATTFGTGLALPLTLTEDSAHDVTATGSYQGSSFTLSGAIFGGSLTLSGDIPGVGGVILSAYYLNPPLVSLLPSVNGVSTQTGDFLIFGLGDSIGLATKQ